MTIVGVSMMRDEADIAGMCIRRMLDEVDYVLVADNRSTDDTRFILDDLAAATGRVMVFTDDDPAYMQSDKMTHLAELAGDIHGADWVIPFDADEVWDLRGIRDHLPDDADFVFVPLVNHIPTGIDPPSENVYERIGWRFRDAAALPKVICRVKPGLRIHQGNHDADIGGGGVRGGVYSRGFIRHYPWRSPEQFVRKAINGAEAYEAAGDRLPAGMGAHWRGYGEIAKAQGPEALADVFREHFWVADPESRPDLVNDPLVGWHAAAEAP